MPDKQKRSGSVPRRTFASPFDNSASSRPSSASRASGRGVDGRHDDAASRRLTPGSRHSPSRQQEQQQFQQQAQRQQQRQRQSQQQHRRPSRPPGNATPTSGVPRLPPPPPSSPTRVRPSGYDWHVGGRTKELRTRCIARKFLFLWRHRTYGRVTPSEARRFYSDKIVRRCARGWLAYRDRFSTLLNFFFRHSHC